VSISIKSSPFQGEGDGEAGDGSERAKFLDGLIQTAVGNGAGTDKPFTKRSGLV